MTNPLVSIVLITYNHEKYIQQSILGVLEQTYHHFELIVVDDGSVDKTGTIVQSFQDDRIKYIFKENGGPSSALNLGIENSKGAYVAFSSGDDVNLKNRLEVQIREALKHQKDVVFSHVNFIDESGSQLPRPLWFGDCFNTPPLNQSQTLMRLFKTGNFFNASTALVKKKLLVESQQKNVFHPVFLQLQDFDCWIRLIKKTDFLMVQEPLVSYRIRNEAENLSAPSVSAFRRTSFENALIYQSFFDNMSEDLFCETFSDLLSCKGKYQTELRKFEQAFLLSKHPDPTIKFNGLVKVASLFEDSSNLKKMEDVYGLKPADFFKRLACEEIFAKNRCLSSVYLDTGIGFNEAQRVPLYGSNILGEFDLVFEVPQSASVKCLRWDPLEGDFSEVSIRSALVQKLDGEWIECKFLFSNGVVQAMATRFYTTDPSFFFEVNDTVKKFRVSGSARLLEPSDLQEYIAQLNQPKSFKKIVGKAKTKVRQILQMSKAPA